MTPALEVQQCMGPAHIDWVQMGATDMESALGEELGCNLAEGNFVD